MNIQTYFTLKNGLPVEVIEIDILDITGDKLGVMTFAKESDKDNFNEDDDGNFYGYIDTDGKTFAYYKRVYLHHMLEQLANMDAYPILQPRTLRKGYDLCESDFLRGVPSYQQRNAIIKIEGANYTYKHGDGKELFKPANQNEALTRLK